MANKLNCIYAALAVHVAGVRMKSSPMGTELDTPAPSSPKGPQDRALEASLTAIADNLAPFNVVGLVSSLWRSRPRTARAAPESPPDRVGVQPKNAHGSTSLPTTKKFWQWKRATRGVGDAEKDNSQDDGVFAEPEVRERADDFADERWDVDDFDQVDDPSPEWVAGEDHKTFFQNLAERRKAVAPFAGTYMHGREPVTIDDDGMVHGLYGGGRIAFPEDLAEDVAFVLELDFGHSQTVEYDVKSRMVLVGSKPLKYRRMFHCLLRHPTPDNAESNAAAARIGEKIFVDGKEHTFVDGKEHTFVDGKEHTFVDAPMAKERSCSLPGLSRKEHPADEKEYEKAGEKEDEQQPAEEIVLKSRSL